MIEMSVTLHRKEHAMTQYLEGYHEAKKEVLDMNREDLVEYMQALQGPPDDHESLPVEDLRSEAIRQCREDFKPVKADQAKLLRVMLKI